MMHISMAGMKKIWLKSLHAVTNIQIFTIQDRQPSGQTQLITQINMILIWIGHNRLHHHLHSKLWISHKEQCPCGTGSQTTKHLLQSCPIYEPFKKGIWQDHTPVARKLYSSLVDLRCTATSIEETGVSIWRTRRRRRRYTARLNKLKYPHSQMEQIKIPTQPDWRETLTETVNIPTQPDGTETLCPHKL